MEELLFLNKIEEKAKLLRENMIKLKIPISGNIEKFTINKRAKKKVGTCKKVTNKEGMTSYIIDISYYLEKEKDDILTNVIAHELIHTCPGAYNHGPIWKKYVEIVNKSMNLNVTTTYKGSIVKEMEINHNYRYLVKCQNCGKEIYRERKSKVINNSNNYVCAACKGRLKVYILK